MKVLVRHSDGRAGYQNVGGALVVSATMGFAGNVFTPGRPGRRNTAGNNIVSWPRADCWHGQLFIQHFSFFATAAFAGINGASIRRYQR